MRATRRPVSIATANPAAVRSQRVFREHCFEASDLPPQPDHIRTQLRVGKRHRRGRLKHFDRGPQHHERITDLGPERTGLVHDRCTDRIRCWVSVLEFGHETS